MGKRIAILCMSLNIGGAETHIYELARGLTAKGHQVTVFSNGGVYAGALEKAGIRHVRTPLHTKSPSAMWKAYRILMREFKKCRPSVVHSHTRISNFVAGLVCKKLDIPMVTTVHFNFKVDFFSRKFSNWGCYALSVSEDLKKYLVDNYRYNPDHVSLTVNGIDMERFSKKELPEFRASLGLEPEQKMILLVSRLDKEASIHVANFLRIAPEIYQKAPDTRVVIVGDGTLFPSFVQRADEINRQCGTDFILLQGAKTNIEQYTAVADLFVGISRSALEAMSSSVPTVLMGNLGYLGLYSDEIREECIETNLTCRGYPYPADQEICDLILECLQGKDLSQNVEEGLRLVKERFSVDTMAATAEKMYEDAIQSYRPLDYMISGYYGCDNFGDNLTLRCLMDHLKAQNGSVLSHNVENTYVPEQVQKIHRFNLPAIYKTMKKTKVFLLGSGSLLQDSTSNRSLFYYTFITKMAMRCNCKTLLYANGIGPITRPSNRKRTAALLNKIDFITLRDQESMKLLETLKISRPAILTADDSFSLDFKDLVPDAPIEKAAGKTIVGVNFKLSSNDPQTLLQELAEGLTELSEKYNLFYYLIPLHLSQDQPQLNALHQFIPKISHMVEPSAEPQRMMRSMAVGKYHIFERLHGQIMATMLGTPFLPINYDPKNHSLMTQIGLGDYLLNHDQLSKERLIRQFEKLLSNEESVRQSLANYTEEARKTALLNQQQLHQMIKDY